MSAGLAAAWNSDAGWSFRHSPVAIVSAVALAVFLTAALFAPWLAPHNPFDLRTLNLQDALAPPAWLAGGKAGYLLGTDDQGRDVLSAIMFGARISLLVGLAAVVLAIVLGVALGLIAGYVGGKLDAFIMRVADVQLSFPAILIALLIDGVARAVLPRDAHSSVAIFVLIFAIGAANWVQYARTVRGSGVMIWACPSWGPGSSSRTGNATGVGALTEVGAQSIDAVPPIPGSTVQLCDGRYVDV
jgi:peptide/nickel transport system permease protein